MNKAKHKQLFESFLLKEAGLLKALFYCSQSKKSALQEKGLNIISSIKEDIISNENNKKIFTVLKDYYADNVTVFNIAEKTGIPSIDISILLEENTYSCSVKFLKEIYDDFLRLYKALFVAKLLLTYYDEVIENQDAEKFEKEVVYKVSQLPSLISNNSGYKDIFQLNSELLDKIQNVKERDKPCKTGLIEFDRRYYGLEKSKTYILAARPGVGKSNMGLNWASNAVFKEGKKALFFSLEMTDASLNERLIAMHSGLSRTFIKKLSIEGYKEDYPNEEYHKNYIKLVETMVSMEKYKDNIFLLTKCHDISSIYSNSVMFKYKYDIDVIFIDYISLVGSKDKDKKERISNVARTLFLMAQELTVPVVVLSQINREGESTGNSPSFSNLSESDVVGQVADMVLIIDKKREQGEALLKIVKARDAIISELPISFNNETLVFTG